MLDGALDNRSSIVRAARQAGCSCFHHWKRVTLNVSDRVVAAATLTVTKNPVCYSGIYVRQLRTQRHGLNFSAMRPTPKTIVGEI